MKTIRDLNTPTTPLAASIIDLILGLELGATERAASNSCSMEGLAWRPKGDGLLEVSIQKLQAMALRLASGSLTLEIGRIALHKLQGQVCVEAGSSQLVSVEAAEAECSGVKLHGPLVISPEFKQVLAALQGQGAATPVAYTPGQGATETWTLGPLAAADGTIRAKITDAHLLFDADVTVPVRQGQIDFNDATVEHVGPDSRMGVSALGLYVDAPNGRSYLFQFASAPIAGVEFEQRGALLGRVSDRGRLRLQAFGEGVMRQARGGQRFAVTEQTRLLLGRTALSGEVQLSDGLFAASGVQAQLVGRSEGLNAVLLHSEAVGRGLTLEMGALSARDAAASWGGMRMTCATSTARLKLQLDVGGPQLRFVLDLANVNATAVRLDLQTP